MWQSMDTAPRREGDKYLIWDGESVESVKYCAPFNYPDHIEHSESWVQISDSGRATEFIPKAWQPLPEPPDQAENKF